MLKRAAPPLLILDGSVQPTKAQAGLSHCLYIQVTEGPMNSQKNWRRVALPAIALILVSAIAYGQNLKTLVSFNLANGDYAQASVVQGLDGNLYGTTLYGGAYGHDNVFKMSPAVG